MAFIAGAVALGGVYAVGHDRHSNYSDYYSDHYNHSNHQQYGDSARRSQISNKESEVNRKASDVESLRQRMNSDFNSRINELKREKNYSGLDSAPSTIIDTVKYNMQLELDNEISQEKQELEAIDKMIARINEIELQAKRE